MNTFLILVSSLAVAACSPTFGLLAKHGGGGIEGGIGADILGDLSGSLHVIAEIIKGVPQKTLNGVKTNEGPYGGVVPVGRNGTFKSVETFATGLTDAVGKVKCLFKDVGQLKLPGVLEDGFNSLIVVGRADGDVVNVLIPGLGRLLSNLVIAIGKIFVCVLGPQGKDIHYICQKDYLSKYGYDDIDSCSSSSEIIDYYKVKNAKQQALKYINDYTQGRGIESLTVNERLVYERVLLIASLFEKDTSKWTSKDLKSFAFNVVVMTCIVVESQQKGLGRGAVDDYIPALKKYNKNKQFPDLSGTQEEVYEILKAVKQTTWNGAYSSKTNEGTHTGPNGSSGSNGSNGSNDSSGSQNKKKVSQS